MELIHSKKSFCDLNIKIKNKLLKCYVHSVLLYGSECWTISPTTENKLKATEMWFYRRMMRISWKDHVSNEEVLRRANTERSLIKNTRQRQLSFLGHIMRKEKIEHLVVTGKIEGKKSRGRPRLTYISSLGKCTGLSKVELLCNTKNRAVWRTMIANVQIG